MRVPAIRASSAGARLAGRPKQAPGHDVSGRVKLNGAWYQATWTNKRFGIGSAAQSRHGGRRPAIHAFSESHLATHELRTFARDNGGRLIGTRQPIRLFRGKSSVEPVPPQDRAAD
jgi:hypothetical protein